VSAQRASNDRLAQRNDALAADSAILRDEIETTKRDAESRLLDSELKRETLEAAAEGREMLMRELERRLSAAVASARVVEDEFAAMRKVGIEVYGFNEQEIGTVFDPRMLHVLRDASEYRRLTANKLRPVTPDKGRTLAPGSARPIGSAARRSIDDALKNQARTGGSIDATAAVFERLLK
jgi:hypothetical protein